MNRRNAILLGGLVALLAAAEIVVLSGLLAAERRDDRDRYSDAITRQRRAAGRAARAAEDETERPGVKTTFCLNGVDTFASTIRSALHRELVDNRNNLDLAELRELSNLAVRAERYVEQASAGPAMPQRMGRIRTKDDQGEMSWKALQPVRRECEDGEAYAAFRLEIRPPSRTAGDPPAPSPTSRP